MYQVFDGAAQIFEGTPRHFDDVFLLPMTAENPPSEQDMLRFCQYENWTLTKQHGTTWVVVTG